MNNKTKESLDSQSIKNNLKTVFSKLRNDRIEINWNHNPIEMSLFLSFLTVKVKRNYNHLGSGNGWTLLENDDYKLKIRGGIVKGKEWLDSIQFGDRLGNDYNNYVNPFYLLDILTEEGIRFFIEYYREDIEELVSEQEEKITAMEKSLIQERNSLNEMNSEIEYIKSLYF